PAVGVAALYFVVVDQVPSLGDLELVREDVAVGVGEARVVVLAALERDGERVVLVLERDGLDVTGVQLRDEVAVRVFGAAVARADELLGEKGQHHHDEDGKGGALEEAAHESGNVRTADTTVKRSRGKLTF